MTAVTCDSIALRGAGIVTVSQPKRGYRFTLDSILLADFCRIKPNDHILEPGAGVGIISQLLAKKFPRSFFSPVEFQDDLSLLCEENRKRNNLENVTILHRDVRGLSRSFKPGSFNVIVANPPYTKLGTGKRSPSPRRHIARQDQLGTIESWLDLQVTLKQGGRYNLVFPAGRIAELFSLMRERGIEPKRLRLVHPKANKPASVFLVEGVKAGGVGLDVLPPLIVHAPDGSYTSEMRNLYGIP